MFNSSAKALTADLLKSDGDAASPEYRRYEAAVKRRLSRMDQAEAVAFIVDIDMFAMSGVHVGTLALYPALREYASRFQKTPWLLVVLFELAPQANAEDEAAEYLRQAAAMDPDDRYVLWQLLVSWTCPWFPRDLLLDPDPLRHELRVCERLLELNPDESLALGVKTRLMATQKPLSDPVNWQFFVNVQGHVQSPLHTDIRLSLLPRKDCA